LYTLLYDVFRIKIKRLYQQLDGLFRVKK